LAGGPLSGRGDSGPPSGGSEANAVPLDTERLRVFIKDVAERGLNYSVCPQRDLAGPGGGVFVPAGTPLEEKHLYWLESRNPAPGSPTFVDVVFYRGTPDAANSALAPAEAVPELATAPAKPVGARRSKAQDLSGRVRARARAVVDQGERMAKAIEQLNRDGDRISAEVEEGRKEFERLFKSLHTAVKGAVDEYLNGNTLVMDLISQFQLDKEEVRHGLSVAAFSTELATQLGLKEHIESKTLKGYFGDISPAELLCRLGSSPSAAAWMSDEDLEEIRMELFKLELVEIFLGGFMHDCGLWGEEAAPAEGHEARGAKIIASMHALDGFVPTLTKVVLFHSDILRLAQHGGAVLVEEATSGRRSFKREFYPAEADALVAVQLRPGNFRATTLSEDDLRKVVPVALAERYITHTEIGFGKSRAEVIEDLAQHASGGSFLRYMVVLCNAQLEPVAPRRAYVRLKGHITILVNSEKGTRRSQRVVVTGCDAGSIHHGNDKNSPHFITLFYRVGRTGRERAEYTSSLEGGLWDRAVGPPFRMYVPAGRYRNSLSFEVTGFLSEESYRKVLGEYEQQFSRRLQ
jgi:hypothetical protein